MGWPPHPTVRSAALYRRDPGARSGASAVEHRVRRTGAEVVLEPADLVPLRLRARQHELQVLDQVLAEVHEDDVAGVEVPADDVEPAVVRRATPQDQRVQAAPGDDAARGLVPSAVRRAEQRRTRAVDGREVGDLVADLVVLIAPPERLQLWVRDRVVLDRRAERLHL